MKPQRILGWSRPAGYEPETWHGIVAINESVTTACNGRWATSETHDFVWGVDAFIDTAKKKLNKCSACVNAARLARTRDGLADFVQVATPEQFFDSLGRANRIAIHPENVERIVDALGASVIPDEES